MKKRVNRLPGSAAQFVPFPSYRHPVFQTFNFLTARLSRFQGRIYREGVVVSVSLFGPRNGS